MLAAVVGVVALTTDVDWVRAVCIVLVAGLSALAGMMAEHRYPSPQLRKRIQANVRHETYARNCRYNPHKAGMVTRDPCPLCPPLEANR